MAPPANAQAVTRPRLMPMSAAARRLSATASNARPHTVRSKNSQTAINSAKVAAMIRNCCEAPANGPISTRPNPNGGGEGRGSAPNRSVSPSRKITSTPSSARIGLENRTASTQQGTHGEHLDRPSQHAEHRQHDQQRQRIWPFEPGPGERSKHCDTDEGAGRGPFSDREIDDRGRPQDQQIGERDERVDAPRRGRAHDELKQIFHGCCRLCIRSKEADHWPHPEERGRRPRVSKDGQNEALPGPSLESPFASLGLPQDEAAKKSQPANRPFQFCPEWTTGPC